MAEIGLPGQQVSVLDGGDVDAATGRLLTVAELQAALLAAQLVASRQAVGLVLPVRSAVDHPAAVPSERPTGSTPVTHLDQNAVQDNPRSRRWVPRWRASTAPRASTEVDRATGDDDAPSVAPAPGAAAPAGFTGPAAVRAWSWLTTAAPAPQVLVCAPSGGVGVTTVVAALAGLIAAARPDRVLAVEVARRDFSPLTRQVCGSVDTVSAGTWLSRDGASAPRLSDLPSGLSGARVVQAGAHWWPRLTEQLDAGTAVVADLGSLEHADTRALLMEHSGPAVMVARADSAGVTAALAALTELDAAGLSRRPVLVLCDAAGSRPGVLRTAQRLAATAADVLVLPKAPALRRSPVPVGGWDRGLSGALADLVCGLARTATPPDTATPTLRPLPIADPTHDEETS